MREIQVGETTMKLRGNTLSLYHYNNEFKRDLMGDLAQMMVAIAGIDALNQKEDKELDVSNINLAGLDMIAILRIVWVLNRTAAGGPATPFPSFGDWIEKNEDVDVLDSTLLAAVMEEVKRCFFRRNKSVAPTAKR